MEIPLARCLYICSYEHITFNPWLAVNSTLEPRLSDSFGPSKPADRLFLAVFGKEDESLRAHEIGQSLRLTHGLRGRPLPPKRLHETLVHLGDFSGVPGEVVENARSASAKVASGMRRFEMVFNRVMSFPRKVGRRPLVMLDGGHCLVIHELQQRLCAALGISGGGRKFTPHVTLLYDEREIAEQFLPEPVVWTVSEIVLVHSLVGKSTYRELGRWELGG